MSETSTINIQKGIRVDTNVYKQKAFNDFVLFISLPDPERAQMFGILPDPKTGKVKPPTQNEFALRYGVSIESLSHWKRRKDFIDAVDQTRRQWGLDRVGNVMASLYTRCIKYGMAYDVETYLAYFANWNRTQVVKHTTEKFDVDDLRAIINSLPEGAQKDNYEKLGELIALAETVGDSTQGQGHSASESGNNQREV